MKLTGSPEYQDKLIVVKQIIKLEFDYAFQNYEPEEFLGLASTSGDYIRSLLKKSDQDLDAILKQVTQAVNT